MVNVNREISRFIFIVNVNREIKSIRTGNKSGHGTAVSLQAINPTRVGKKRCRVLLTLGERSHRYECWQPEQRNWVSSQCYYPKTYIFIRETRFLS